MATALSVADLRGAAKLYRRGVEGAEHRLRGIIEENLDELPGLLNFPPENLHRLREHDDPVAVLVGTIEGAPKVLRGVKLRMENRRAAELAEQLGHSAVFDSARNCELNLQLLAEVACLGDHRFIVFGDRGAVSSRKLHQLFHEVRRVSGCSALLTDNSLCIVYMTDRSRGIVRLHLQPVQPSADAVVVPLSVPPREVAPAADEVVEEPEALGAVSESSSIEGADSGAQDARYRVPEPAWAPSTPERAVEPPRGPAVRPSRPRGVMRFIDALSAAVGGGR
jgi:hypothetical protein